MTPASEPCGCDYCGGAHKERACPRVKAIEYGPNGRVSRVEFHDTEYAGLVEELRRARRRGVDI